MKTVIILTLIFFVFGGCNTNVQNDLIELNNIGSDYFGQIDAIDVWESKEIIAIAEHSGRISLWDYNGNRIKEINPNSKNSSPRVFKILENENTLMQVGVNSNLKIWNIETGKLSFQHKMKFYTSSYACLSNDESLLSIKSEFGHEIYKIKDFFSINSELNPIRTIEGDKYGQDRAVFLSQNELLITLSTSDTKGKGTAFIYDPLSGNLNSEFLVGFQVQQLEVSNSIGVFATGTYSGGVSVYSLKSKAKLFDLVAKEYSNPMSHSINEVSKYRVNALTFSKDGNLLMAGRGSSISIWNIKTKELLTTKHGFGRVAGLRFINHDKSLIVAGLKSFSIINVN